MIKKQSSYLKYWNVNNLYGWGLSQKWSIDGFKWVEDTSQFNKDFREHYNWHTDGKYFLEVDVQYPEKLHDYQKDLHFLPERMKIEKF